MTSLFSKQIACFGHPKFGSPNSLISVAYDELYISAVKRMSFAKLHVVVVAVAVIVVAEKFTFIL